MNDICIIGIVDVGCANIGNISNALAYLEVDYKVIHNSSALSDVGKIILPGVGSFPFFMQSLQEKGFIEKLNELFESGRSMLGICLGMQVFYEFSDENNGQEGLALVHGNVKKFDFKEMNRLYKVPHISWTKVEVDREKSDLSRDLFVSIDPDSKFYFLHSYYGKCRRSYN